MGDKEDLEAAKKELETTKAELKAAKDEAQAIKQAVRKHRHEVLQDQVRLKDQGWVRMSDAQLHLDVLGEAEVIDITEHNSSTDPLDQPTPLLDLGGGPLPPDGTPPDTPELIV